MYDGIELVYHKPFCCIVYFKFVKCHFFSFYSPFCFYFEVRKNMTGRKKGNTFTITNNDYYN